MNGRTRYRIVRLAGIGWTLAKTGGALLSVSIVLAVAALVASSLYAQYGAPRAHASALSWAARPATYQRTDCRECHAAEAATAKAAPHQVLLCETCHTPTVDHPGDVAGVMQALPAATASLCITCHSRTSGRPADFPQIQLADHYSGADCLRCHDPHSSQAATPPTVSHPLANLPACTTCHSPTGLKRYPAGHQPAADSICLGCHRTEGLKP